MTTNKDRTHRTGTAAPIRRFGTWFGGLLVLALAVGVAIDISRIDPTSGAYEPPFTDYVGEPIDWDADTANTEIGMVRPGYILNVHTDCTTGMISFEVLGLATFDYRNLSERALAIHEPRQACLDRGFHPDF